MWGGLGDEFKYHSVGKEVWSLQSRLIWKMATVLWDRKHIWRLIIASKYGNEWDNGYRNLLKGAVVVQLFYFCKNKSKYFSLARTSCCLISWFTIELFTCPRRAHNQEQHYEFHFLLCFVYTQSSWHNTYRK